MNCDLIPGSIIELIGTINTLKQTRKGQNQYRMLERYQTKYMKENESSRLNLSNECKQIH